MSIHIRIACPLVVFATVLFATLAWADTTYSPPKLRNKLIDRCVNDGVKNHCDRAANKIAADAFCRAKGDQEAVSWRINTRNIVPMSVKRAAKTLEGTIRFVDITGLHTFTQIVCKSEEETQRYFRPTQNGMRIDKCVQGAGWGLFDPKRCNSRRQREVSKKFCLEQGFRDQFSYRLEGDMGNHAILTFRRGTSYRTGVWTQVAGADAFREIVCVR